MDTTTSFGTTYTEEVYSFPPPVTVIIGLPWEQIGEDQRTLLSKILLSVKQSLDSVRIVQLPRFDLSSYQEKPSRVLSFVAPPKGLALYEVVQTDNTSVIFSDALESLITDDAAKRKLWNSLKTLFA